VVTSSHVVAPWKWPKYYPDEWLKFVNENYTHYSVELRHPDGMFETQNELAPISYHHPSKDIAVLHLMNEDSTIEVLKQVGYQIIELSSSDQLTEQSVSSRCCNLSSPRWIAKAL
jgi:hypothetical protein